MSKVPYTQQPVQQAQQPGMPYGQPAEGQYAQQPGMQYAQQPGQQPGMQYVQQPGVQYVQQPGVQYVQQPGVQYVQQPGMRYAPQQQGVQQVVVVQSPPPSTYMVWSILNCLFCCCLLGIAAICYSNKVTERMANNDQVGALEASRTARKINIAATVVGIIVIIIIVTISIIYTIVIGNAISDSYHYNDNY